MKIDRIEKEYIVSKSEDFTMSSLKFSQEDFIDKINEIIDVINSNEKEKEERKKNLINWFHRESETAHRAFENCCKSHYKLKIKVPE